MPAMQSSAFSLWLFLVRVMTPASFSCHPLLIYWVLIDFFLGCPWGFFSQQPLLRWLMSPHCQHLGCPVLHCSPFGNCFTMGAPALTAHSLACGSVPAFAVPGFRARPRASVSPLLPAVRSYCITFSPLSCQQMHKQPHCECSAWAA